MSESAPNAATEDPSGAEAVAARARLRDYALLLKPRVMSLVVFTGVVGLALAPGHIPPWTAVAAVALIAAGAGASGAINMWYDRDIDARMTRTMDRPLPSGRLPPSAALWLGTVLSVASIAAMAALVNVVAAALLAGTIGFYVFIYTIWLKRRTPQNIVIGGAAGAFPPMIGWAAVTGSVDIESLVLFAIIFLWTPPHFWALALFRNADYARAGVPMLPVVAGIRETKRQIIVYSVLLVPTTALPVAVGLAGWVYGMAVVVLGVLFLVHAFNVWRDPTMAAAKAMFFFSILYLFLIYVFLLVDKAVAAWLT